MLREDKEKCKKLLTETISMPEMARMLGIQRNVVYSILNSGRYGHFFQYIVIAGQKRITKESFHAFLCGQDKYKLALEHGDGENISACAEHREKDEEDLSNTQGLDQNCEKGKKQQVYYGSRSSRKG